MAGTSSSGDLNLVNKIVDKITSEKGRVTMDRVKAAYEELKGENAES